MRKFSVISVTERIYIFVGDPATGKTFFAKSIQNATIVDEVNRLSGLPKAYNRVFDEVEMFNSNTKIKFGKSIQDKPTVSNKILVFITNDELLGTNIYEWIMEITDLLDTRGFSRHER